MGSTSSAAGLLRASRTRCASIGLKMGALPPTSTPRSAYHSQVLLLRIKIVIMDLALHVSASNLERDEHIYDSPHITLARSRPRETHEPDHSCAGSALAQHGMQHGMQHGTGR